MLVFYCNIFINPRRACAARVTVVVLCVCVSVRTRYFGSTRDIKMAVFFKLSYSKVRAFFTYLGRGGHF